MLLQGCEAMCQQGPVMVLYSQLSLCCLVLPVGKIATPLRKAAS
jgi:hypothetical protein